MLSTRILRSHAEAAEKLATRKRIALVQHKFNQLKLQRGMEILLAMRRKILKVKLKRSKRSGGRFGRSAASVLSVKSATLLQEEKMAKNGPQID